MRESKFRISNNSGGGSVGESVMDDLAPASAEANGSAITSLSGLAKDLSNVAVVIAVLMMGLTWVVILAPMIRGWISLVTPGWL